MERSAGMRSSLPVSDALELRLFRASASALTSATTARRKASRWSGGAAASRVRMPTASTNLVRSRSVALTQQSHEFSAGGWTGNGVTGRAWGSTRRKPTDQVDGVIIEGGAQVRTMLTTMVGWAPLCERKRRAKTGDIVMVEPGAAGEFAIAEIGIGGEKVEQRLTRTILGGAGHDDASRFRCSQRIAGAVAVISLRETTQMKSWAPFEGLPPARMYVAGGILGRGESR
jgi:hypothetical protein